MAKQMTIRGVPEEVSGRLETLSRARGQSVNAVVLGILAAAVETEPRRLRLERLATWSDAERREFDTALAEQRVVDENLWR